MADLLHAARPTSQRSTENAPAQRVATPAATHMDHSPRVRALGAQQALLNAAPMQFGGGGKKGGKGGKGGGKKERTEDELVRTFGAYGSSRHSEADIRAAIQSATSGGKRLAKGHRSGGKGDGMNSGTVNTMAVINAELRKQTAAKKQARKKKRGKRGGDSDDEDIGFVPRHDKDRDPPYDDRHDRSGRGGGGIMV